MIPEGTYEAVATNAQWGTTAGGTEQVAITFRILDGPQRGHTITWFGFFTDKTYKRTLESLRYCGWRGNKVMELGPLDQKVNIEVGHEEYEGRTVARVQWVNRYGSGRIKLKKPMTPEELRDFSATLEAKASEVPEVEGERVASEDASTSADSPLGDDIPF